MPLARFRSIKVYIQDILQLVLRIQLSKLSKSFQNPRKERDAPNAQEMPISTIRELLPK